MKMTSNMQQYVLDSQEEIKSLIKELCNIPAPSNHETLRAAFCKDWFLKNGFPQVFIDEYENVVCPVGVTEDNDITVIMAHTDIVFPDTTPLPFKEEDGRFCCPGVGDDTANLATMMVLSRYMVKNGLTPVNGGVVFVANSGEEGLGNLRGSRGIVKTYGKRIREFISLDGQVFGKAVNHAVGSHRYEVTVTTEGGHSYGAFGNRNAIAAMASMINTMYSVKVPQEGSSKTTYNVGVINGGSTVNSICQKVTMLCEYRSDNLNCLNKMKAMFEAIFEAYRATGVGVEVKLVGDRPCAEIRDPEAQAALESKLAASYKDLFDFDVEFGSGSTDCNSSLAEGIPSVCFGVYTGAGAHSREEYINVESLKDGAALVMDFLCNYFE